MYGSFGVTTKFVQPIKLKFQISTNGLSEPKVWGKKSNEGQILTWQGKDPLLSAMAYRYFDFSVVTL